jgi:hypothetical protein
VADRLFWKLNLGAALLCFARVRLLIFVGHDPMTTVADIMDFSYNFVDASSHNNGNVQSISNNIFDKRGISGRLELALYAIHHRLIDHT